MKRIFILSLLLIAFVVTASSKNFKPVNKKASPEAKALLESVVQLTKGTDFG